MSAEQERVEEQREIDAEVAASAVAMRAQRAHEQSGDGRGQGRDEHAVRGRHAAGREYRLERREAAGVVLREHFLDERERHLTVKERAVQQVQASSILHSQLLDARERRVVAQEQAVDQREIDAELVCWPEAGTSSR